MTHTDDKTKPPTWPDRLYALRQVEHWAQVSTALDETEWTDAFTDAQADALCEYFQTVAGHADVLSLALIDPTDEDDHARALALTTMRAALDQLRSELQGLGGSDAVWETMRHLELSLVQDEADLGRETAGRMVAGRSA